MAFPPQFLDEIRTRVSVSAVVGMAVGTVFTLYVVPAFYMLIATDRSKVRVRASEFNADGEIVAAPAK